MQLRLTYTNMSWNKKHNHKKPYKKVICIYPKDAKLLSNGYKNVIDENETQYLIQFASGAANWYKKTRFVDAPIPKVNEKKKETRHSSGTCF